MFPSWVHDHEWLIEQRALRFIEKNVFGSTSLSYTWTTLVLCNFANCNQYFRSNSVNSCTWVKWFANNKLKLNYAKPNELKFWPTAGNRTVFTFKFLHVDNTNVGFQLNKNIWDTKFIDNFGGFWALRTARAYFRPVFSPEHACMARSSSQETSHG